VIIGPETVIKGENGGPDLQFARRPDGAVLMRTGGGSWFTVTGSNRSDVIASLFLGEIAVARNQITARLPA
jgi:hypothetical protein